MRFLCQFDIEGRVKQVNAQLIGEIMYCEEMVFSYSIQAPNFTAAFAVIWNVNKTFDNPENIHGMNMKLSSELPEEHFSLLNFSKLIFVSLQCSSSDVRAWPRAAASAWNSLKNTSVVGIRTQTTPAKCMSTATAYQLCG
ncbi:hypothetical protein AVEN_85794-1 [Araneus ventricosus]|uniref:Plexin TIG domain-containing protein n=1 Tax=Araneus ventricosus TaxID=182803 RepID=A0A4Y2CP12_ARAVE|nr:hypothetical protein AVEN_85794-1 [Araneus ventricosus]